MLVRVGERLSDIVWELIEFRVIVGWELAIRNIWYERYVFSSFVICGKSLCSLKEEINNNNKLSVRCC